MINNEAPTQDILAYALKELTKDWSQEKQIEFSKECFNMVVQNKYNSIGKIPVLNITITRQ